MQPRAPRSDTARFLSADYHTLLRELRVQATPAPTLVTFSGAPRAALRQPALSFVAGLGRAPFRVDLDQLVSKYIGETEKNLGSLFARADPRAWVLFFDEADALFGSRGRVRDTNDRYANLEVNYLLSRLAGFRGVIVALLEHPEPPGHRPPFRHVRVRFPPA